MVIYMKQHIKNFIQFLNENMSPDPPNFLFHATWASNFISIRENGIIPGGNKSNYTDSGSSAKGVDLPGLTIRTYIKVTSIRQPQSSSPFKDAKQKIFGLGYNLLVFVYDKVDDPKTSSTKLDFVSCSYLDKERTADYTTTFRIRKMVKDGAIKEDIIAYLNDKNIIADDIALGLIADQILNNTPKQGYLTISNALQWRLQYARVVNLTDKVDGITKVVDKVTK